MKPIWASVNEDAFSAAYAIAAAAEQIYIPRTGGVLHDLAGHDLQAVELFLGTEEGDQVGLDDPVVDVFVEVEQPDLEQGGGDAEDGGVDADVRDARQLGLALAISDC